MKLETITNTIRYLRYQIDKDQQDLRRVSTPYGRQQIQERIARRKKRIEDLLIRKRFVR